jgi:hypothetical protein
LPTLSCIPRTQHVRTSFSLRALWCALLDCCTEPFVHAVVSVGLGAATCKGSIEQLLMAELTCNSAGNGSGTSSGSILAPGLRNQGNTCYLNSAVQMLAHVEGPVTTAQTCGVVPPRFAFLAHRRALVGAPRIRRYTSRLKHSLISHEATIPS